MAPTISFQRGIRRDTRESLTVDALPFRRDKLSFLFFSSKRGSRTPQRPFLSSTFSFVCLFLCFSLPTSVLFSTNSLCASNAAPLTLVAVFSIWPPSVTGHVTASTSRPRRTQAELTQLRTPTSLLQRPLSQCMHPHSFLLLFSHFFSSLARSRSEGFTVVRPYRLALQSTNTQLTSIYTHGEHEIAVTLSALAFSPNRYIRNHRLQIFSFSINNAPLSGGEKLSLQL